MELGFAKNKDYYELNLGSHNNVNIAKIIVENLVKLFKSIEDPNTIQSFARVLGMFAAASKEFSDIPDNIKKIKVIKQIALIDKKAERLGISKLRTVNDSLGIPLTSESFYIPGSESLTHHYRETAVDLRYDINIVSNENNDFKFKIILSFVVDDNKYIYEINNLKVKFNTDDEPDLRVRLGIINNRYIKTVNEMASIILENYEKYIKQQQQQLPLQASQGGCLCKKYTRQQMLDILKIKSTSKLTKKELAEKIIQQSKSTQKPKGKKVSTRRTPRS